MIKDTFKNCFTRFWFIRKHNLLVRTKHSLPVQQQGCIDIWRSLLTIGQSVKPAQFSGELIEQLI